MSNWNFNTNTKWSSKSDDTVFTSVINGMARSNIQPDNGCNVCYYSPFTTFLNAHHFNSRLSTVYGAELKQFKLGKLNYIDCTQVLILTRLIDRTFSTFLSSKKPALFTTMSIWANCLWISLNERSTSKRIETSVLRNTIVLSGKSFFNFCATSGASMISNIANFCHEMCGEKLNERIYSLKTKLTVTPFLNRFRLVSKPIPLFPPVTIAVLPAKLIVN